MNIFLLSWDVDECARWHGDKHVGKMALEGTQLLCNAWWFVGGEAPYRPTHMNHPCSVWVRMNVEHWIYLRQLVVALGAEFEHRFGKKHRSAELARKLPVPPLPHGRFIVPPLVVPEQYQWGSVPISYRLYYANDKKHLHQWTRREEPWWIEPKDDSERFDVEVRHPEPGTPLRGAVHVGLGSHYSPRFRVAWDEAAFTKWTKEMWRKKGIIRRDLRGKDLACFCCAGGCPGSVLAEIANGVG